MTSPEYIPWASSGAVRSVMRANSPKRDTRPELRLRHELHRLGLRYRVAARPLAGRRWTADLVFAGRRVAVFVDGCWWHACPEHYSPARTNPSYWGPKIERNRARDAAVNAALRDAGWRSVRVWEHTATEDAVATVLAVLAGGSRP